MSTMSTPHSANGDDHQHIRLACQACQRKKIKCDRSFPCGQCARSNLHCVPSTRKPRARHAGKRAVDSELRNRITKLESLVESLSGEVGLQDDDAAKDEANEEASPTEATSPTVGKYLASPFWSSLTEEVQAIKDALEEDQGEEDQQESTSPETTPSSGAQPNMNDFDLLICPPGAIYVMPGALSEPPAPVQQFLYETFIRNVDPMFKIFHVPTLRAFFQQGAPYLGHDNAHPGNKALRAAAWFGAVNTMTDEQCRTQFGQPRLELMQQYRRAADVMLAQADLINTTDMATLQAFVTLLINSRMTDLSRRVWTLTSLAVRIARAMGLHSKAAARIPFETEMRRRLWHQIRFLDVFAAMDRATEVLITQGSFDTPMPNNVSDSEFDEQSTTIPHHDTGVTDMGFALVAYEAVKMTQRLTTPETSPTGDTWQQRLVAAQDFAKLIQEKFLRYCDHSKPFQRLVYTVGKSMSASMVLRAIRPMQRHVSSVPPRIDSPYVLQIATETLAENEKIYTDNEFAPWRWLIWVQWHALAISLAGLCSIRGTELADRAWRVVEANYERQLKYVADTRHGMLWRPIEKLYKKARAFRDEGRRISASLNPSPPAQQQQSSPAGFDMKNLPTMSPISYATTGKHPQQPSLPTGSVPIDPTFNVPMDFLLGSFEGLNSNIDGMNGPMTPMPPGDMSWLDWEHIMSDLNMPDYGSGGDMMSGVPGPNLTTGWAGVPEQNAAGGAGGVNLGDIQQPNNVVQGQNWPCNLHQDLM